MTTPAFAPITAKIIADSINPIGNRLTTWELTYPRFIHSELMTHRMLSKNSASSRAIPAAKLRQRVIDAPAGHVFWGANQKGMQASGEVAEVDRARTWWLDGLDRVIPWHERGEAIGLHKQIVNRIIEPWMMITVICSGTEWANFFHLRNHPDAEPNFQRLASTMWSAYTNVLPDQVPAGGWHLPYIDDTTVREVAGKDAAFGHAYGKPLSDDAISVLRKIAVGRLARVSYLTHDGKRDIAADLELHDRLVGTINGGGPGHFSPFEHVARALNADKPIANFRGWEQYRAFFTNEAGPNTTYRCMRCGMWDGLHVSTCPRQVGP